MNTCSCLLKKNTTENRNGDTCLDTWRLKQRTMDWMTTCATQWVHIQPRLHGKTLPKEPKPKNPKFSHWHHQQKVMWGKVGAIYKCLGHGRQHSMRVLLGSFLLCLCPIWALPQSKINGAVTSRCEPWQPLFNQRVSIVTFLRIGGTDLAGLCRVSNAHVSPALQLREIQWKLLKGLQSFAC